MLQISYRAVHPEQARPGRELIKLEVNLSQKDSNSLAQSHKLTHVSTLYQLNLL
jgi:hypothetical protein